jgi:amino acid transporter
VISYLIGAVLAMVSAVTFAEMAVDYPLAGSSFNYTLAVMGEFPAWCAPATAQRLFVWT